MKPESKIERKAMRIFNLIPQSYWFKIEQSAKHGDPDQVGCVDGMFVGIEWKTEIGRLSPLQRWKLNQINTAGGLGLCLDNVNWFEWRDKIFDAPRCECCGQIKIKELRNGPKKIRNRGRISGKV